MNGCFYGRPSSGERLEPGVLLGVFVPMLVFRGFFGGILERDLVPELETFQPVRPHPVGHSSVEELVLIGEAPLRIIILLN